MLSTKVQNELNIIRLAGERTSGSEHDVWMDNTRGLVFKIPNTFGKIWQKMNVEEAQRDLEVMRKTGVKLVPQEVIGDALVQNGGATCKKVRYCVAQLLYGMSFPGAPQQSHALNYTDLYRSVDLQRQLFEFFLQGQEIRKKENLGFDMLGGQIVSMIPSIVNPLARNINPKVSNLLVADTDITSISDFPVAGVEKGETIAKKGEVMQCDTRMYDFDRKGIVGRVIKSALLKLQDAQDSTISSVLESFNFKTGFDTDKTLVRRMVRALFNRALPKMRAYAECI